MNDIGLLSVIPLKDAVAATSVGIYHNTRLLDLCYDEDCNAEVDFNVVMTGQGKFVEIQGTAEGKPFSKETIDSLESESTPTRLEEKIALSLACHSAVRAGKVLSHEEMRGLMQQLERAVLPRTCPHGRPTMIHLSSGRLEKEFGRG